MSLTLSVVPCSITEARNYVAAWHRHLPVPPKSGRFAVAVIDGYDCVRGVAIVGNGARLATNRYQTTVTRVATDETKNACSMLYAACARTWRAMGGRTLITYTLEYESGTSLLAAGWHFDGVSGGGSWNRAERPRDEPTEGGPKVRWRSA